LPVIFVKPHDGRMAALRARAGDAGKSATGVAFRRRQPGPKRASASQRRWWIASPSIARLQIARRK
jgi:hypothetical protein